MAFYLFLLFAICFISMVITMSGMPIMTRNKALLWSVGLLLLFFAMFRGVMVGADYYGYLNYLITLSGRDYWDMVTDETLRLEKGYVSLTWFLGNISLEPLFFSGVVYSIFLFFSFRIIGKYSHSMWLSLFLFVAMGFYSNSYNTLRQSLAMCICWYGIPSLINNHRWRFLLTVFIAFLFHKTALLFAVIALFGKRITMKQTLVLLSLTFVAALALGPIVDLAVSVLNLIDYTEKENSGGGYTLLTFFCMMLFAMRYVGNRQSELKNNRVIDVFLNMLLLAVLIQVLALKLSILTRCTEFFRFSLVILIPNVLMSFKKKERMLLITVCIALFAIYFVVTNKSNWAGIIPYEFINLD